jgi:2-oxoisovalerate dehydrogenase E2 component (dihydrolipoyl transacylase)
MTAPSGGDASLIVCDGGTAGGLLRFVANRIESPITALGEM